VKNPLVARLRSLHEQAKRGKLDAIERAEYGQLREELGRMLLIAQHLAREGKTLRAALRMTSVMKVQLESGGAKPIATTTIDVSQGGFAALLEAPQLVGRTLMFELHLPNLAAGSGTKPISGTARVASCRKHGTTLHRVSFAFADLDPRDREHLEMSILDAVLSRFESR
jgi:hypothetical protein